TKRVGRSSVSAMTHTPASGPFGPVTTPAMSSAWGRTPCAAHAASAARARNATRAAGGWRRVAMVGLQGPRVGVEGAGRKVGRAGAGRQAAGTSANGVRPRRSHGAVSVNERSVTAAVPPLPRHPQMLLHAPEQVADLDQDLLGRGERARRFRHGGGRGGRV